ncbi:MAG TPA: dihydrolipoamide acetyltransferase family protein [Saprospiraceae bacterium]|nr:dihydrolipoamide acetyltransferase family protein [Saprospiraceae bacterium]
MAKVELIMPKMGESIMEATILKWLKKPGDSVEMDETILEIATDKVDSEIPSPAKGIVSQLLFKENDVVPIGKVIAILDTEGSAAGTGSDPVPTENADQGPLKTTATAAPNTATKADQGIQKATPSRFYSPLVRNIAKEEHISIQQLDAIAGSGLEGRVTKRDLMSFIEQNKQGRVNERPAQPLAPPSEPVASIAAKSISGNVEIIEMDRMRKMIAEHMVMSKHTSPHVTSFVEVDVTNIVQWRDKIKDAFLKKYNQKITFTPIFIEAIAKAIKDYPLINVSVQGTQIIRKIDINIGMAAALPTGNLIVPVIKNADRLNLAGLTYQVNDLAERARNNKLKPDEIQDGTFTLTNVGTFGNVMGTPIINQPQVAIMAVGAIRKKPAVVETPQGDTIGIRQMMFLSMSYDHRVVDGALGGSFIKKVADYLEQFDIKQTI